MMERRVSTREIEYLLTEPDSVIRQSRDKIIACKRIRGRHDNLIAVVAVELNGNYDVVTVLVNFKARNENTS
jgi:hypothetical protein